MENTKHLENVSSDAFIILRKRGLNYGKRNEERSKREMFDSEI